MNQAIFELGLSTEATSLYLLLVHLSDSGAPLNLENASNIWNAGSEDLENAASELLSRRVLGKDSGGNWHLTMPAYWQ